MSRHINQKKEAFLASGGLLRSAGLAVPVAGVSPISIYIHQAHHLPAMQQHPGRARGPHFCMKLRHYKILHSGPAPVFSPTGTALALKSGNSCIRRVRMIIPAVPFFDFSTTIYAAVLRSVQAYGNSNEQDGFCGKAETFAPHPDFHCLKTTAAQLLADAVSTPTSTRAYSHNQVTETASVFTMVPTNPGTAATNPFCSVTGGTKLRLFPLLTPPGSRPANSHSLFTEGRDAGHTPLHPFNTAGTAEKGEYSELSEDRADRVSPRIRRSRFLQTQYPALCRGNSLGAVYCVGLDIQTGNAGFKRAGDVAAPSFRPHQPNLNNPARCVVYAAGYRTGDAPKSVRAYDNLHRPVLSFVPSAEACSFHRRPGCGKIPNTAAIITLTGAFAHRISCMHETLPLDLPRVSDNDTLNCFSSRRGLYGEGLFARQVFIRFKTFTICWSSSVGRPNRKRPSRGEVFACTSRNEKVQSWKTQ